MGTPADQAVSGPAQEQQTAPPAEPSTLASIFAPVAPARGPGAVPQPPLGSTATLSQTDAAAETGNSTAGTGGKNSTAGNGDGPVGALVRAIAARLGRTGTATTVKRQHTVTETRVSGNQSTSTSKNDRLHKHDQQNKHDQQHRTARDTKLADLNTKASQARSNRDMKKSADAKTSDTKAAKADTSAKTSRDSRDGRDSKTSDTSAKTDTKTAKKSDSKGSGGAPAGVPAAKPSGPDKPTTASARGAKTDEPKTLKPDTPGAAKAAEADGAPNKDADAPGKAPDLGKAADAGKAADGATRDGKATGETAPRGPKPRTQPSREAGYRDGRRAAAVTGHIHAWRDGLRDGYDHGTAATTQEKERMDTARDRNATRPRTPTMAPASGSTINLTKQANTNTAPGPRTHAVPVQVDDIGTDAIRYTADSTPHSMSRREVRTLKGFERRLGDKRPSLHRIAEAAKSAAAEAAENANRAEQLADGAKNVHGGDALVRAASRLAEQAQVLRAKADEIHKRASRGSEALDAVIANADTRHGVIYQAVVDSPLTAPAEAYFYQDKRGD